MIWAVLLAGLGPCAELANCTAKLRTPAALLPQARAALAGARLPEGEPKTAPSAIDPKVLRGDKAFAIEIEPDGEAFVVRALSLHRAPSVFGRVKVTPQALPNPKHQAKAVEIALRGGIARAMEDLSAQLAEAVGQGRRVLKLSVRVSGLSAPARQFVAETFLPCLKSQFDLLGPVTEPREVAGYLEDEVEYAPLKDEPRDSLDWQAKRLRDTSVGQKAQCPLPAKVLATFNPDTVNRGVIVELK
ncbi:MAG: hypothetical protein JNK82_45680 [Myxococcaceae bacterium]|nr:hypothetical protein [Myxococcaceae bacterium]